MIHCSLFGTSASLEIDDESFIFTRIYFHLEATALHKFSKVTTLTENTQVGRK